MIIRDATVLDLDAVWEIETAVFGAEAWSREALRSEIEGDFRRYVVLVDEPIASTSGSASDEASDEASENARVVGYAGLLVIGTDGDIQTIAVSPEARGSGHGRRLMDTLLNEATKRGATQVFLEVRADNPVARALYTSLGFEEIGIRPHYYQPDNVDAVVMRLQMEKKR